MFAVGSFSFMILMLKFLQIFNKLKCFPNKNWGRERYFVPLSSLAREESPEMRNFIFCSRITFRKISLNYKRRTERRFSSYGTIRCLKSFFSYCHEVVMLMGVVRILGHVESQPQLVEALLENTLQLARVSKIKFFFNSRWLSTFLKQYFQ